MLDCGNRTGFTYHIVDKSHTKTLAALGRSHCDLFSSDEEMLQRISRERCMISMRMSMDGSKGWVSFSVLGGAKVRGIKHWTTDHTAILLSSRNVTLAFSLRLPIISKT